VLLRLELAPAIAVSRPEDLPKIGIRSRARLRQWHLDLIMLGSLTAAASRFVPNTPRTVAVPLAVGAWVTQMQSRWCCSADLGLRRAGAGDGVVSILHAQTRVDGDRGGGAGAGCGRDQRPRVGAVAGGVDTVDRRGLA
jgi:hypothetical protein